MEKISSVRGSQGIAQSPVPMKAAAALPAERGGPKNAAVTLCLVLTHRTCPGGARNTVTWS